MMMMMMMMIYVTRFLAAAADNVTRCSQTPILRWLFNPRTE